MIALNKNNIDNLEQYIKTVSISEEKRKILLDQLKLAKRFTSKSPQFLYELRGDSFRAFGPNMEHTNATKGLTELFAFMKANSQAFVPYFSFDDVDPDLVSANKIKLIRHQEEEQRRLDEEQKKLQDEIANCNLRNEFPDKATSLKYFTQMKHRIKAVLVYLNQKGINAQKESPATYREKQRNPQFQSMSDAANFADNKTNIDYFTEYKLEDWNPTGCITDEDTFWEDYYNHLNSSWSTDKVEEIKMQADELDRATSNITSKLNEITSIVTNIHAYYFKIPKDSLYVDSSFQQTLEKIISQFQSLRNSSKIPGQPTLFTDKFTYNSNVIKDFINNDEIHKGKSIVLQNQNDKLIERSENLNKIAEFVEKNRIPHTELPNSTENILKAVEEGKGKLFTIQNRNGSEQTFAVANFKGDIKYAPMEDVIPDAPKFSPGDKYFKIKGNPLDQFSNYEEWESSLKRTGESSTGLHIKERFADGGKVYSFEDEQIITDPESTSTDTDKVDLKDNSLRVNHADMLGKNRLADDDTSITVARVSGLFADIGAITANLSGATPAAVTLDALATILHGYADIKDDNVSIKRALANFGLNSLSTVSNLVPAAGAAVKLSTSGANKIATAAKIGKWLLVSFSAAMSVAQYKETKYAVEQLGMMVSGDIEATPEDAARHIKTILMMVSLIAGVMHARVSTSKNIAHGMHDSTNRTIRDMGTVVSDNTAFKSYDSLKNIASKPFEGAAKRMNKVVFGEETADAIRTSASFADKGDKKAALARLIFGNTKVTGGKNELMEVAGLRDVADKHDFRRLSEVEVPNLDTATRKKYMSNTLEDARATNIALNRGDNLTLEEINRRIKKVDRNG